MGPDSFNTLMGQNSMANGKRIFGEVMVATTTQMEINTKVIGAKTYKMESELITTQMGIFIKANGLMGNHTDKETTYIIMVKEFTKEIGKTAKRKALASWLLMTIMAIRETGRKTRRRERDLIFIPTANGFKVNG
jgi:hypothetical protein